MQQIPIPSAEVHAIREVEGMHDLVTALHTSERKHAHPRDLLMRDYYEDTLNALVYELYLPDDLHTAGLQFFDLVAAASLPQVDRDPRDPDAQLSALRRKFEDLYSPSHPLRAALQKLHTLDPIRIIEGKA